MSRKSKKTGIVVFVVILIITAAIAGIGVYESTGSGTNATGNPALEPSQKRIFFRDAEPVRKLRKQYIAALYIEGTIEDANKTYNQEWLLSTINALIYDENNKAILLYINSPGGGVYQADEVYLALCDYKKTGKTVYAYMGPLAASGGYYIACAADSIYANRNTLTGSIGVIAGESIDATELLKKLGVKSETITAGKNKNMLNYNSPLTDEQRAIMQSVADEAYEQFTGIVAESRGMKPADVKKLADGRIYTAAQAQKNGLIDHIGSWDDAVSNLSERATIGTAKVITYRYKRSENFFDILSGAATRLTGSTTLSRLGLPQALADEIRPDIPYPAYIYIK
ncbi:MAG TPA: signal peptide peptidase SppA [Treponema sp.]|nr:signal peptide peptidase SppA [Treponema sp.]